MEEKLSQIKYLRGKKKTDKNMSRDGPVRKPQGIQNTWRKADETKLFKEIMAKTY